MWNIYILDEIVHPSELTVEVPKLKTWDMYKQLVEESSRLRPKVKCIPEQPVIDVSTLSKIHFKYEYIHQIFITLKIF